ncbi:head-tail connector protein [Agathobaculum sp. Marseille-P7918]|uniref:head-tail connector protein n=1 Tax=Agathobaculum sp. Marseille-P7918 TaxID=2479843 RepID=UPI000F63D879|nr:head-tail connector protein [Agathobaculum sp. Marseille-P7918]
MTTEEKAAQDERLAACKRYMRVDYDEDDELIAGLMQASDAYLIGAGIRREVNEAQHDLIVQAMTLQMYDARGADTPQQALETVPPLVRSMFNQLKIRCNYGGAADGTGG